MKKHQRAIELCKQEIQIPYCQVGPLGLTYNTWEAHIARPDNPKGTQQ